MLTSLARSPSSIEFPRSDILRSISDRFEDQVRKFPDRAAIITRNEAWTYAELNGAANRIARFLLAERGQRSEGIALLFEPGAAMLASILGTLKAGKFWVPLDPSHPTARNSAIVSDSGAALILAQAGTLAEAGRVAQNGIRLLDVESISKDIPEDNLAFPIFPDDPAYLLYTSGSTGQPKGVIQTQRNVLHAIWSQTNLLSFSCEDRFLLLSSYSHHAGLQAIHRALLNGAALLPFNLKREALPDLARWIEEQEITVYASVPTVFRHFMNTLRGNRSFPSVRIVHLGGEALSRREVDLFKRHFSDECVLLNNFGATETYTCRRYLITKETPIAGDSIPVGYPVDDKEILLLDESGREVAPGQIGEIAVRSPFLTPGYWRKPELTAQVFRTDPDDPKLRIYHTGDLGRLLPDGCLFHIGRKDQQIKIRGQRVETGEIESTLMALATVKEAVVVLTRNPKGEEQLTAYLVTQAGRAPSSADIRSYLRVRLPEYMMPSHFVFVEMLPLTASGKVDRRALTARTPPEPEPSADQTLPRNPTEEKLAHIWSQILGRGQLGVHDHFFVLGGDSLRVSQLVYQVREAFRIELPLRTVFESPTIAGLAQEILRFQNERAQTLVRRIEQSKRPDRIPLSFSQQRLWFLDQLEPGTAVYNIFRVIHLQGPLNRGAIQSSFNELIRRHEVLRTTFEAVDGEPFQQIHPPEPFKLGFVDLTGLEKSNREACALELARLETRRPFDLGHSPLLRATLLSLQAGEHVLVFTIHHIAADGWSMRLLSRELALLYGVFDRGEESPLTPGGGEARPDGRPGELPIQYADYSLWQRERLQAEPVQQQLAYWKKKLENVPPLLELPTDRPRKAGQNTPGSTESFWISPSLADALNKLAREENATLFITLLAAFQTLLHRYSAQSDIVVGSPISGRTQQETSELIGFFVNTIVLSTDFSDNPSFRKLLTRARATALEAYENQEVPFEKLVEVLQPVRNLTHSPLFQVMFVLQNLPYAEESFPGIDASRLEIDNGLAMFDLTLSIAEMPEGLKASFEYNTDLFDASTIRRMVGHFQQLLTAIIEDPSRRLSDLTLLTERERRQLLVEWNSTTTEFPPDQTCPQLFERQALATPDATAVVFENKQLTYRQLNEHANALAHELQRQGVGPETLVGICVERSLKMVVGILGILKAGGAYVPLDPGYPKERLAFMIEDSKVKILLTQNRLLDRLPKHHAHVLCLDDKLDSNYSNSRTPSPQPQDPSPDDLAYVIYTSGSTGKPKGVEITHRSLINHSLAVIDAYRLSPGDRVLQFSSLSFDVSVEEIFPTWLAGATVVLRPGDAAPSIPEFLNLVERERITVLNPPTAYWHELVLFLGKTPLPSTVRLMVLGGEKASEISYGKWKNLVSPAVRLMNCYGPTEATVTATFFDPNANHGLERPNALPIGRPLANMLAYILDRHGQPVPIGVPGELHIGGAGLARGYLNRPDLTAEKFIPNPFVASTAERLYKTGDRARFLADGNIEFLGRVDHQVKIRGFRIELGEIESVLAEHTDVREAAIAVHDEKGGGKRLVACLVPRSKNPPRAETLKKFLRKKLPEHMIPSHFVVLDKLPVTPSGKIDRRALPDVDGNRDHLETAFVAPRDDVERRLAAIWSEVLGLSEMGIRDNFFEVGGHSILAVRLVSRIQKDFQRTISLADIFNAPTIREMANLLSGGEPTSHDASIVPIQSQGTKPPIFWPHTLGGGGGGGFFRYKKLAELLGPDQPSFGIQAPPKPFDNLVDMAAHYIVEMDKVQPKGPYFLAGYCFGGYVAFEIAQQLRARGDQVAFLGLLETPGPSNYNGQFDLSWDTVRHFVNNLYFWLDDLSSQEPKKVVNRIRNRLGGLARNFKSKSSEEDLAMAAANIEEVLDGWEYPEEYKKHAKAHWLADVNYVPKPYDGRALLFRVQKQKLFQLDPSLGWKDLIRGGIQIEIIPGSHESIFDEPRIQALARLMRESLEKAHE